MVENKSKTSFIRHIQKNYISHEDLKYNTRAMYSYNIVIFIRDIVFCFHPWCPDGRAGGQAGGRREIVCPGCISETVRCRKLILGRDIG